MKLNELKHNHSLTDLLKVIIFSLLMFAPMLSVATRCMYVIVNKNAYQSASITSNQQHVINNLPTNEVNSLSDLIVGKYYEIQFTTTINEDTSFELELLGDTSIENFELLDYKTDNENRYQTSYSEENKKIDYLKITIECTNFSNIVNSDNTNDTPCLEVSITTLDTTINNYLLIKVLNLNGAIDLPQYYHAVEHFQDYSVIETQATTLDNVFEYSVNKLEDNQLFNWTKNTGIYTGVSAMTTQLQIEGAVIPILITYWFLLTIIYVIIDIVLKLFTILTHLIGSKTT